MPSLISETMNKGKPLGDTNRPAYQFDRPMRIHFIDWIKQPLFKSAIDKLYHSISHTILPHAQESTPPLKPMSFDEPKGKIEEPHIELCKLIFERVENRRERLEEKSSSMLTMLSILAPLVSSFLVFFIISDNPLSWLRATGIALAGISVMFIILAVIASLRTLWVHPSQTLYFDSIIDYENDTIKTHNPDAVGRGLLFTASYNNALNDHLADFVKSSQFFSMLSIIFLGLAVFPAAYDMPGKPSVQPIEGEISIKESSMNQIRSLNAEGKTLLEQANRHMAELNSNIVRISALEETLKSLVGKLPDNRSGPGQLRKGQPLHQGSSPTGKSTKSRKSSP